MAHRKKNNPLLNGKARHTNLTALSEHPTESSNKDDGRAEMSSESVQYFDHKLSYPTSPN